MPGAWLIILCLILAAVVIGGAVWQYQKDIATTEARIVQQAETILEPPARNCAVCGRPADPITGDPPLCAHCLRRLIMKTLEPPTPGMINLPMARESFQVCAICNKSGRRRFYHVPEAAGPVCGYCVNRRFKLRAT